ncbi:MAG: hypothetical protein ACFE0J_09680 [Elainellaceae cyanobacterium]
MNRLELQGWWPSIQNRKSKIENWYRRSPIAYRRHSGIDDCPDEKSLGLPV